MALHFGGPGVTPSNKLGFGNRISLAAGQVWPIQPAGSYWVIPGKYTTLQLYDPILQTYVTVGGAAAGNGEPQYIESDGSNYRLANLTGCPVGAIVTAAGTGFTSAPSVTIASGSSVWQPVLGSYVSAVTVSNGGTNYTYAPTVTFSAPPAGGVPATGYIAAAQFSGGVVTGVTMINKGGGYLSPPTVTFVNDPREGLNGTTVGYGASGVAALAGSGGVNAVICLDPGNTIYTATTAFTTSGGGGSGLTVSPIFCLAITGVSAAAGGPFNANTGFVAELSAVDSFSTTVSAPLNVAISNHLVKVRKASVLLAATTGSVLTSAGAVIVDGGIYSAFSPIAQILAIPTAITTTPTVTFALGGIADTSYISS